MTEPQQSTTMGDDEKLETFAWELNLENIRPLRSGRHASSLHNIGSRSRVSAKEAQERFRDLFDSEKIDEDPLAPFYEYVCWFEENFPSGRQNIFYPILWKIVQRFATLPTYRNEERMLKLWFKLAENCPERCFPIISYAFDKHCCTKMADFYIRWSELYECCGDFESARTKLNLGKRHLAEPMGDLDDAIIALEMRILRKSLKERQDSDCDDSFEESREVFGRLQGVGTEGHAPIIRRAFQPAGKIIGLKRNTVIGKQGAEAFSIFASEMEKDEEFLELFGSLQFENKQELGTINSDENKGIVTKFKVKENRTITVPTVAPAFKIFCDDPEVQRKTEEFYKDARQGQVQNGSVDFRTARGHTVTNSKSAYKPPKQGHMQLKLQCCVDSIEEVFSAIYG